MVLGIIGILVFNFWAGMEFHWDYAYPLHVDEWIHLSHTQALQDSDSLQYPSPLGGGSVSYNFEFGFHTLLSFTQELTGLSWQELYRVAPGIQMSLIALSVYALGSRNGYGLPAALLLPLVPTSVRTLGPGFLVPVSTSLIFIPLTLLVISLMERPGKRDHFLSLLILVGGTLFIHPTTEGVVTGIAIVAMVFLILRNFALKQYREATKSIFGIGVRIAIPVFVLTVWLPDTVPQVLERTIQFDQLSANGGPGAQLTALVDILGIHRGFMSAYGSIGVGIFLTGLGMYLLFGRGLAMFALPVVTILLVVFLFVIFPRFALGHPSSYERGWIHLAIFMVILGGYTIRSIVFQGAQWAQASSLSISLWPKTYYLVPLYVFSGVLIGTALFFGLTGSDRSSYQATYHLVDDIQAADFAWVGSHAQGSNIVMETSLAFAFPALAGPGNRAWLTTAAPFSNPNSNKVNNMVRGQVIDIEWLRGEGITLLYTCLPASTVCTDLKGHGLSQIRKGLYWIPPQMTAVNPP